ncbi:MAG: SGNH/GDSL hydrolase family protein [Saprospiraceae bacterium]|nr:SGNH/GDSL hydrolase family protein [Saprospiraceae bacterium]
MMRLIIWLLMHSLSAGCAAAGSAADGPSGADTTIHILFVGNSLTFANDLPNLVSQQAREKGIVVQTRMITRPNYALIDHLAEGIIQQAMSDQHYDFVVVQQGPSSQDEGRQMLLDAGRELSGLCLTHQSQLAFFMVWPSRSNQHTFEGVIKNYTAAAVQSQAILCPVGEVWKRHVDASGSWDYYGPDGFHPSLLGSQVAAAVIAESLFGGR